MREAKLWVQQTLLHRTIVYLGLREKKRVRYRRHFDHLDSIHRLPKPDLRRPFGSGHGDNSITNKAYKADPLIEKQQITLFAPVKNFSIEEKSGFLFTRKNIIGAMASPT